MYYLESKIIWGFLDSAGPALECQNPGGRPSSSTAGSQGILRSRCSLLYLTLRLCMVCCIGKGGGGNIKDISLQLHFAWSISKGAGADVGTTCSYQATFAGFEKAGYSRLEAEQLFVRSIQLTTAARDQFWTEYQAQVCIWRLP